MVRFLSLLLFFVFLISGNSNHTIANEYPQPDGCDNIFLNAEEINSDDFIRNFLEKSESVMRDTTYSYVFGDDPEASGDYIAEFGPFDYNLFNESLEYFKLYKPSEFDVWDDWDFEITAEDILLLRQIACDITLDKKIIRDFSIKLTELLGEAEEWKGHAANWEDFPYIETGNVVIESPSPEGLGHYKKYVTGGGVIIVGGKKVPDAAMLAAREAVVYMTSEWDGIRNKLKENKVRISLFGPRGDTSKLPEYKTEHEPGGFAMGLTDTSMTANSEWLCYEGNWEIGGNTVIHELVHSIQHTVMNTENDLYFYERIVPLALSAIERGIYGDFEQNLSKGVEQNISHLVGEYWAISVEGYIMNKGPDFKNSHYTREWIKENDPGVYDLIRRYYPKAEWDYCPGVEKHMKN